MRMYLCNSDSCVISTLDGLDVTTEWLSRHVTPTTPLSSMDDKRAVISQAYLELLTWNDENEFPEVFTISFSIQFNSKFCTI